MRTYNARRRLKHAICAVQIIQRMHDNRLLREDSKLENDSNSPVKTQEGQPDGEQSVVPADIQAVTREGPIGQTVDEKERRPEGSSVHVVSLPTRASLKDGIISPKITPSGIS